ncbi:hypothetical protein, partial [Priestia megaterium]|uniref:hypothetical protein n=1 Tax=Priestia megaterium TaxID=1404 RepID=UPI003EEB6CEA
MSKWRDYDDKHDLPKDNDIDKKENISLQDFTLENLKESNDIKDKSINKISEPIQSEGLSNFNFEEPKESNIINQGLEKDIPQTPSEKLDDMEKGKSNELTDTDTELQGDIPQAPQSEGLSNFNFEEPKESNIINQGLEKDIPQTPSEKLDDMEKGKSNELTDTDTELQGDIPQAPQSEGLSNFNFEEPKESNIINQGLEKDIPQAPSEKLDDLEQKETDQFTDTDTELQDDLPQAPSEKLDDLEQKETDQLTDTDTE